MYINLSETTNGLRLHGFRGGNHSDLTDISCPEPPPLNCVKV